MQRDNVAFRMNNASYYRSVLQSHPLFADWPNEVLSRFAKLWNVVSFDAGKTIVSEGMVVDNIYFIIEGNTEVITHDKLDPTKTHTLAVLSAGESIGLSATGLYSKTSERTATVVALSKVLAITIKLKTLQTFLHQHPNLDKDFTQHISDVYKMQLAKESIPFARLSSQKILALAKKIEEFNVPAGQIIFNEGEPAEDCYLVSEGKIEISKLDEKGKSQVLAVLSPPAIFGEMAIVLNEPRNGTAKALTDVQVYRLHRTELLNLYSNEQAFAKSLSTLVIKRSRPEQIADVIDRHEINADMSHKVVLKNIKNKQLYNLNERGFFAWTLMNGISTIDDINYMMQLKYGPNLTEEILELISDLYDNGFIRIRGYRFPKRSKKSLWSRLIKTMK